MSLGFLTESALLPSKSKPIKVDSGSILDLKSVVEQQQNDLEDSHEKGSTARVRRRVGGKRPLRQQSGYEDKYMRKRNKGVDDRNRMDDSQWAAENKSKQVRAALERKAALYEKLSRGEQINDTSSEGLLVDFAKKGELVFESMTSNAPSTLHVKALLKEQEISGEKDFVDEFGRSIPAESRFVAGTTSGTSKIESSVSPGSKGEKSGGIAGGVTSQWERKLRSEEKSYLVQISEKTNQARNQPKMSRKELRRQKIRAAKGIAHYETEELETSKQAVGPAEWTPEKSSASEMASAFLSSLANEHE